MFVVFVGTKNACSLCNETDFVNPVAVSKLQSILKDERDKRAYRFCQLLGPISLSFQLRIHLIHFLDVSVLYFFQSLL